MTRELKKAWKKTFKKWENIIENNGKHLSEDECGLCKYDDDVNYGVGFCYDCPIEDGCRLSPYTKWEKHPTLKNAEIEYLFLLFVYEATKDDKED